MKPFAEPEGACPKCGATRAVPRYVPRSGLFGDAAGRNGVHFVMTVEHIAWDCAGCAFTVETTRCKDASPPAEVAP